MRHIIVWPSHDKFAFTHVTTCLNKDFLNKKYHFLILYLVYSSPTPASLIVGIDSVLPNFWWTFGLNIAPLLHQSWMNKHYAKSTICWFGSGSYWFGNWQSKCSGSTCFGIEKIFRCFHCQTTMVKPNQFLIMAWKLPNVLCHKFFIFLSYWKIHHVHSCH